MSIPRDFRQSTVTVATLIAIACLAGPASAGDWPNWRGPAYDGSSDESNLPAKWTSRDVKWSTPMPGRSSATPVIWGDRVFVVSNDAKRTSLHALSLNRDTGEVIWNKRLVTGARSNARNDMASCSPVTDGKLVYFMFGNSELFALDFDGNPVWSKNLDRDFGPITPNWGYSSSPLLYGGRLYIPVLRGQWGSGISMMAHTDDDSYVLCLDAATGETVWKVHRASDAVGESFDSYATPVPFESNGETVIVVQGGDYLTGHDADTGVERWRQGHNPKKGRSDRLIPSPVVAGDVVCGVQARGGNLFAVFPGKTKEMEYSDSHWIYDQRTTDVPTPLYYEGKLYVLIGTRKLLLCIDPVTGKEIWRGDLGSSSRIWASPTAGDGKIYFLDERGQVTVVAAGDEFKVLSQSELGGAPSKSSIALADSKLFIRTADTLYCIASDR